MALCWHSASRGECKRVCAHWSQGPTWNGGHETPCCCPMGCELKPVQPHVEM